MVYCSHLLGLELNRDLAGDLMRDAMSCPNVLLILMSMKIGRWSESSIAHSGGMPACVMDDSISGLANI